MADGKSGQRRSEALRFRVREDERHGLDALAESLGLNASQVIRRLVREAISGGPEFFDDGVNELRATHRELAAIGRNVNQLAKRANRGDGIVPDELRDELVAVRAQVDAATAVYREAVKRARRRTVAVVEPGTVG